MSGVGVIAVSGVSPLSHATHSRFLLMGLSIYKTRYTPSALWDVCWLLLYGTATGVCVVELRVQDAQDERDRER